MYILKDSVSVEVIKRWNMFSQQEKLILKEIFKSSEMKKGLGDKESTLI